MRRIRIPTCIAAVAAVIIILGPSTAPASRLSFLPNHKFVATSRAIRVEAEGRILAECPLTLEGEYTFNNVDVEREGREGAAEALAIVRSATVGTCGVGTFRFLPAIFPFNVAFVGWLGGNPLVEPERVTGMLWFMWNVGFLISETLSSCLYTGHIGVLKHLEWSAINRLLVENGTWELLAAGAFLTLRETLAGVCFRERINLIGNFTSSPTYAWQFAR